MNMDFPGNGKADFQAKVARGRIVRFVLKLDHVKTPWFDISSNIYGGWKFIGGKGRKWNVHSDVIQGKIKSYYTLVDYKPFRDLEFIFQAEKDMLIMQKIIFGPLSGKAAMTLDRPHILDGKLELTDYNLADFLSFWIPQRKHDSGGSLDASIRFQGTPDKLYLRVRSESYDGFIKHFNFEKMLLNFNGVYPRLYISDANVMDRGGMSFSIIGPLDLSQKNNIKQQIEALTVTPLVVDSERKSEWTIRRFEDEGETSITSFKAFLNKSEIGVGDTGMIGVERKIEF
jgi:hypothetical protein